MLSQAMVSICVVWQSGQLPKNGLLAQAYDRNSTLDVGGMAGIDTCRHVYVTVVKRYSVHD